MSRRIRYTVCLRRLALAGTPPAMQGTCRELRHLHEPLHIAECCVGLTLQPTTCKMIAPSCTEINQTILALLERVLPKWRNLTICDAADCIGVVMVPASGATQWKGPVDKYNDGCKCVNASGVSVKKTLPTPSEAEGIIKTVQICLFQGMPTMYF